MTTARARHTREKAGLIQLRAGSYRAAETTRNRSTNVHGGSGDTHADHRSRRIVREISRQLERDAHVWGVLHGRWLDDIGVPMPRFVSSSTAYNEWMTKRWIAKARRLAGGWDARGLATWGRLCRLFFGSVVRDGDAMLVKSPEGDGTLSLIESDCIDSPSKGNQHQRTSGGMTLNGQGAVTQWWICPRNTSGYPDIHKAKPYDADQVEFCAHRTRQSQTRGMPPLVAGIDDFERGDSLLESTVIQAEQAANIYGVIKKVKSELARAAGAGRALQPKTHSGEAAPLDAGASNDERVPDYVSAARGALMMLYDDQEFTQVKNENPNLNVPPFMQFLLRLHSLGLSYPYEFAFMDMNSNSWSNGKILVTLARHGMTHWREDSFNPPLTGIAVWQLGIWNGEYQGEIPSDWDAVEWDWPELPWPDPKKEEETHELALRIETTSLRRISRHWQAIQDERAEEGSRRDQLAIKRIAEAQKACNLLNESIPGLRLHWSHIVTLQGATTAPGAYIQGANPQSGGAPRPDDGPPKLPAPADDADDQPPADPAP